MKTGFAVLRVDVLGCTFCFDDAAAELKFGDGTQSTGALTIPGGTSVPRSPP
jgi:hypothetical protein